MFNFNLKKQKQELEDQLRLINSQIFAKQNQINNLQDEIQKSQEILKELKFEIKEYQGIIEIEDLGFEFKPILDDTNELEQEKSRVEHELASLVSFDLAIKTTKNYLVDNSQTKGRKFQKAFGENLLIGFNSFCNKKRKSITAVNYNKTIEQIEHKFNQLNKKADIIGASIARDYLNFTIKLIDCELSLKIIRAEEKERIKEEHRRLKEQEKLLAEAEKTKIELQKQRRMYEQSLTKALTEQERQEFEAKLKEIDKREADVDYRINNSKAGYLYITATKAMPNMTKLGVTRRLNPLVRIQELSSAATPYPFVCYGLVFSDDAFELETKIHEYFDSKRVNTENKHKEFFYITPQEAIKVLKEEFGCDVHFVNDEGSEDEDETN